MLSLSNASFPSYGWPLDDILPCNNNSNNINGTHNNHELSTFRECLESNSHSPFHQTQHYLEPLSSTGASGDQHTSPVIAKKKKENHNANERDRRMKITTLYSVLRSLLPPTDETKRLSIPGTVSQAVKYIPELQKEVTKMYHNKEELLLAKSVKQNDQIIMGAHEKKLESKGSVVGSSLMSVSASSLADNKEVLVQFSTAKFNQNLMSKVLEKLEGDGLCALNASSYQSGDKIFHSLHLQVDGSLQYELDVIPQRLLHHCGMRN